MAIHGCRAKDVQSGGDVLPALVPDQLSCLPSSPAGQQHRLGNRLLGVGVVGDHAAGEAEGRPRWWREAVLQAPVQEGAGAFAAWRRGFPAGGCRRRLRRRWARRGCGPVADLNAGELGRSRSAANGRRLQPRPEIQLGLCAVGPDKPQARRPHRLGALESASHWSRSSRSRPRLPGASDLDHVVETLRAEASRRCARRWRTWARVSVGPGM